MVSNSAGIEIVASTLSLPSSNIGIIRSAPAKADCKLPYFSAISLIGSKIRLIYCRKANTVPASVIESKYPVTVNIAIKAIKNNPSTIGLKIANVLTSNRPACKNSRLTRL